MTALAQRGGNHPRVDDASGILGVVAKLLLLLMLNLLSVGSHGRHGRLVAVRRLLVIHAGRTENVLHVLVGEENDAHQSVVTVLQHGLGRQGDPVLLRLPDLELLGRWERQLVDVAHVQDPDGQKRENVTNKKFRNQ